MIATKLEDLNKLYSISLIEKVKSQEITYSILSLLFTYLEIKKTLLTFYLIFYTLIRAHAS